MSGSWTKAAQAPAVPRLTARNWRLPWSSRLVQKASRVEPRDYVDAAAALQRYTVNQLISLARRLDPGLEDRDFSDAGTQLDRMPDGLFTRYGLSPQDVARLREQFAAWPRT